MPPANLTFLGCDPNVITDNTHTSKANLSSIVYYITGHGYGHAVRSGQVIRSLKQTRPDLDIHVRTTAPDWLFPTAARYTRECLDVGVVQRDSLEMDLDATLNECRMIHDTAPRIVERELAFVRAHDVRVIVGDIPPLCFKIADRAAIPSVAVTNFTWDGIYGAYLKEHPEFEPLIEEMRQWYAKATLALALPYALEMNVFKRREPIPWIARHCASTKVEARNQFNLPNSATIVLLSFGGLGLQRLPWDKLKQMRDCFFVTTGEKNKLDGNILTLPGAQRQYEDLVRAVDVIVTKPGYGIVADAIAHHVPVLYTDRGEFPEYPRLVQGLNDCAIAEFIPQTELFAGNLGPYLKRLLAKKQHWPTVALNGAQLAAQKILAVYSGQT